MLGLVVALLAIYAIYGAVVTSPYQRRFAVPGAEKRPTRNRAGKALGEGAMKFCLVPRQTHPTAPLDPIKGDPAPHHRHVMKEWLAKGQDAEFDLCIQLATPTSLTARPACRICTGRPRVRWSANAPSGRPDPHRVVSVRWFDAHSSDWVIATPHGMF